MSYSDVKCYMVNHFFSEQDNKWVNRNIETGELFTEYRPGMMYYNNEYEYIEPKELSDYWWWCQPTEGKILLVILPNKQHWCIDSRASNCDRKYELHHCWCRHGEPPLITVDKNGNTCGAGAGSILVGDYHGFLTNGILSETR